MSDSRRDTRFGISPAVFLFPGNHTAGIINPIIPMIPISPIFPISSYLSYYPYQSYYPVIPGWICGMKTGMEALCNSSRGVMISYD